MDKIFPPNQDFTPNHDYFFEIKVNPDLDSTAMVSPIYTITENLKVKKGSIGLIQFQTEDDFRSGVICHEAVHCATAYMRLFEEDKLFLDDECDDNEERLAYLVGWFGKEITNYYYDVVCKSN